MAPKRALLNQSSGKSSCSAHDYALTAGQPRGSQPGNVSFHCDFLLEISGLSVAPRYP